MLRTTRGRRTLVGSARTLSCRVCISPERDAGSLWLAGRLGWLASQSVGAGTWARCQHRASASLPFVREPRCTPQTKLDVRLRSAVGELLLEREVPRSLLNTLLPRLKVNYCRAATLSLRSINIWIQTERAGNLTKNGSG